MIIAGLILSGLAALLHVAIFALESLAWTSARSRRIFGTTQASAEATKELAFNQGFYNLFLAISVAVGIGLYAAGVTEAGITAVFIGITSMAAAATVLFISSPDKRQAAMRQGALPLLALIATLLGIAF